MNDDQSKFQTNFYSHLPENCMGWCSETLPVIDSSLKVDHFEFLMNRSNIACFMINKRTRCRIYITYLIINLIQKHPECKKRSGQEL